MLWRKIVGYWKSIVAICLIAYGCLLRKPLYTMPPIENGDKWVHWLAFMILTLFLFWDSKAIGVKSWKTWLLSVLFPVIYGGFIEVLQDKFFYPRIGDWRDWLADCMGGLVGIIVWLIIQKWNERRVAQ